MDMPNYKKLITKPYTKKLLKTMVIKSNESKDVKNNSTSTYFPSDQGPYSLTKSKYLLNLRNT